MSAHRVMAPPRNDAASTADVWSRDADGYFVEFTREQHDPEAELTLRLALRLAYVALCRDQHWTARIDALIAALNLDVAGLAKLLREADEMAKKMKLDLFQSDLLPPPASPV
jgi:hypothetical protein